MRILHVNNQASVGFLISRAQRELGHSSDLLAVVKNTQRKPDFRAGDVKDIFIKLLRMAPRYDLIHVHGGVGISGIGLLPFKVAGKRFFAHYHGSELREGKQTSFHTLCERLFISTPDLAEYGYRVGGRELIYVPNPVFMEGVSAVNWSSREITLSGDDALKIAHLPSRRDIKGTDNIIRSVREANSKGANLDLDIIEKVPVNEAMKRLERADLCIDWMSPDYRIHGVVSIEAMIREIPVICNIDRSLYPEDIPVIDSDPSGLTKALLDLWDRRSVLPEIGRRSRRYAVRVHEPLSVARRIERYL